MDASITVSICSWILAEMVRVAEKDLEPEEARALVDGLVERRYPVIEDVGGRLYFHGKDLGARKTALVLLLQKHPRRVNKSELRGWLKNHRFKPQSIANAFHGIHGLVDLDEGENYRLLSPGIMEAEAVISSMKVD